MALRSARPALRCLAGALVVASAVLLAGCRGGGAPPPPTGPPSTVPGSAAWHARSTPLAIEYLRTLPDDRIGRPLAGIALSDGRRWLEGFVYRGRVRVEHPGMRVVALSSPLGEPLTLVWIDDSGQPWPLPECGPELGGVRARTLSGHVYTWRALRPGDGIVSPGCPPEGWPEPGPALESESALEPGPALEPQSAPEPALEPEPVNAEP